MQIGINIANHRDLLSKRYIHDTARMAEDLGFDSVWIPDHAVVPRAVEARYGPVYYDAMRCWAIWQGSQTGCVWGPQSWSFRTVILLCSRKNWRALTNSVKDV